MPGSPRERAGRYAGIRAVLAMSIVGGARIGGSVAARRGGRSTAWFDATRWPGVASASSRTVRSEADFSSEEVARERDLAPLPGKGRETPFGLLGGSQPTRRGLGVELPDVRGSHGLSHQMVGWLHRGRRRARGPTWVVDDTGFLQQGKHSVGVQRQYTGSAGKITNCQIGVSLEIATPTQHAPIDFEHYLPETSTNDPARRHEARASP